MLGIMNALGEIIKSRRKEFGLTQTRLAELSKVGVNTLTQIERGEGNPTIRVIESILETLGLQLTATTIEV
jgi:transcriptional regulator with XRE-family HTH domain